MKKPSSKRTIVKKKCLKVYEESNNTTFVVDLRSITQREFKILSPRTEAILKDDNKKMRKNHCQKENICG